LNFFSKQIFGSLLFLASSAAVKGGIYRRGAKYSADFKQRIVRSVLEAAAQGFPRGWNQRIATQYLASPAYLSKLKARVEQMDSSPSLSETVELYYGSYQGGTQEPLVREDIMCYLLVVIEKDPTLYIWEMKLLLEHQFVVVVVDAAVVAAVLLQLLLLLLLLLLLQFLLQLLMLMLQSLLQFLLQLLVMLQLLLLLLLLQWLLQLLMLMLQLLLQFLLQLLLTLQLLLLLLLLLQWLLQLLMMLMLQLLLQLLLMLQLLLQLLLLFFNIVSFHFASRLVIFMHIYTLNKDRIL
jgi:hypothetical protein